MSREDRRIRNPFIVVRERMMAQKERVLEMPTQAVADSALGIDRVPVHDWLWPAAQDTVSAEKR